MKILEKNLVLSLLEKLNARAFFLLVFIYQLLFIFQGFEMSDEGFNATFYQEIYRDPVSVQYNFMFWLTGMIGGAWTYIFPGLGLFGIRLAGVLVTTSTIIICYNLLKKYLNPTYLKLGLLLVLLVISNDTKEIYYNNLSALFYIIAATLLFSGLKEKKSWKLFVAGIVIALNVFIRLPSAMGVGLVLAIIYYGFLVKTSIKQQVKQVLLFGAGGIAATGAVFLSMKLIGHLDIFLNCVNWVVNLGKSADTGELVVKSKDSSGYYGLMTQIKTFIEGISSSLRYSLFVIILAIVATSVGKYMKSKWNMGWLVRILTWLLVICLCIGVLRGSRIFNYPNLILLYIYSGLTIITTVIILLGDSNKDIKLLAFIGAFITVTYPIGSRGGLTSAGIYSFWLSFPVIINYLFGITELATDNYLASSTSRLKESISLRINETQLYRLRKYGVYICLFGCLYSAYFFPFSDLSNRIHMRYSINNNHVRGIYTTQKRAAVMNELLIECERLVKPGDYLFAYDAIPMIHYMTETRPYIKNSYPWLYTVPVLLEELKKAQLEKKVLPVVIQQRSATNSHRSIGWPQISTEEFSTWNEDRNTILDSFLLHNNYKEVWQNDAFKIFISSDILIK